MDENRVLIEEEPTEDPVEAPQEPEAVEPEPEPGEPEPGEAERIAALEAELAAARADFYNYRQRANREKQEAGRRRAEDVITAILPVLDNLDRALMVPEEGSARDVLVGVRMVQRQFLSALEGLGVGVIPALGQPFDPSLHEAAGTVPVAPEQDGTVVEEQLRGYRTQEGKVLRPSRVTVGRAERPEGM